MTHDQTEKTPNPQGKGLVAVMQDLHAVTPSDTRAKPAAQILADYFTSMLVLSAQFRFKPAVGQTYYLYWWQGNWSLSLIAPEQWSDQREAAFAGRCELHPDMTWSIDPARDLAQRPAVMRALARFHEGFVVSLDNDEPLEAGLPGYVAEAPYYQRLFASALSRSLHGSMSRGGQLESGARHWLAQLPDAGNLLLSNQSSQ